MCVLTTFIVCLNEKTFQVMMAVLVALHCRPPWFALTKQAQCKCLHKLLKLPNAAQIKVSPVHATSLVAAPWPVFWCGAVGGGSECLVTHSELVQILQRQTEGRVPVFSHEVVPDHLRTKPDPEVEEQEKQLITDAARISPDVAQVGEEEFDTSAS